jgi:medium-chain acyl-[acyl-carrier-protein] hydrolase
VSSSNKWFVSPQIKPEAESRIFLFPYAGSGPAVFSKWTAEFPSTIEAQIVHYPGRGSRYNEAPIKSLAFFVESLAQAIQPLLDKPFAFFGHSMGGMIAFELAHYLRQRGHSQPSALFISACAAPQVPKFHPPIHTLPDDEFLKSLKELNGMPSEISHDIELINTLLPVLRADFELIETYQHVPGKPLECPILAFSGLDDPRISREQLEVWALHTSAKFESKYYAGDHFFINMARTAIIEKITSEFYK